MFLPAVLERKESLDASPAAAESPSSINFHPQQPHTRKIPQHSSHTTNPRGSPSPEQLLPIPGHMEAAAPAPSQQSKNHFSSPALAIPRSRRIPGAPESNSRTQEFVGFVTQTLRNL